MLLANVSIYILFIIKSNMQKHIYRMDELNFSEINHKIQTSIDKISDRQSKRSHAHLTHEYINEQEIKKRQKENALKDKEQKYGKKPQKFNKSQLADDSMSDFYQKINEQRKELAKARLKNNDQKNDSPILSKKGTMKDLHQGSKKFVKNASNQFFLPPIKKPNLVSTKKKDAKKKAKTKFIKFETLNQQLSFNKSQRSLFDRLHVLLSNHTNNTRQTQAGKTDVSKLIEANKKKIQNLSQKLNIPPQQRQQLMKRKDKHWRPMHSCSQWKKINIKNGMTEQQTDFDSEVNQISMIYEKNNKSLQKSLDNKKKLIELQMIQSMNKKYSANHS